MEGRENVAYLCSRLCIFRRSDFHPGKMWDQENRFHRCDGHPHGGGSDFFMDHSAGGGFLESDFIDQAPNLVVFASFRSGDRSELALLF